MATLHHGTIVGARTLRVLAGVMTLARTGNSVTVRGLCELLGLASTNSVQSSLARLERHGLIRRERGKAGTVVPTVEFIPAEAR